MLELGLKCCCRFLSSGEFAMKSRKLKIVWLASKLNANNFISAITSSRCFIWLKKDLRIFKLAWNFNLQDMIKKSIDIFPPKIHPRICNHQCACIEFSATQWFQSIFSLCFLFLENSTIRKFPNNDVRFVLIALSKFCFHFSDSDSRQTAD